MWVSLLFNGYSTVDTLRSNLTRHFYHNTPQTNPKKLHNNVRVLLINRPTPVFCGWEVEF